jgi:hypothetical protein
MAQGEANKPRLLINHLVTHIKIVQMEVRHKSSLVQITGFLFKNLFKWLFKSLFKCSRKHANGGLSDYLTGGASEWPFPLLIREEHPAGLMDTRVGKASILKGDLNGESKWGGKT